MFDIILFYFIWNEYFSMNKKSFLNYQDKCFPEKYSWH